MRERKTKKNVKPSSERIMQFAWSFAPTFILDTAVKLRLFDHLETSAKTMEQLARDTQSSVRGLSSLLDALVSFELLQRKGNRYSLTPESSVFLVSTKPDYHGGFFHRITGQVLSSWMQLTESVRTGRPATALNEQDTGAEFFAELVEGIFPMSYRAAQTLARHLRVDKLAGPASVLDIGAGSGVWGIALAQESPHLKVLAVDWPKVLEVTKRTFQRYKLADRLEVSAGDFLEADLGQGHSIATIGHILHSDGRERSQRLLKKVFEALAPGGTVAIAEFVPNDERNGPPHTLIFALNMLVHTTDGGTFTFKEISTWLRDAGFRDVRRLDAPAPSPLILATKPKARKAAS